MNSGLYRLLAFTLLVGLNATVVLLFPRPVAAATSIAVVLTTAFVLHTAMPLRVQSEKLFSQAVTGSSPVHDLTSLIDPLAQGILLVDDDLVVLAANQALARIVDHSLESMIGASLIRATRDIEIVAVARERPDSPREAHLSSGAEVRISAAPINLPLATGHAILLIAIEDISDLRAAQRARSDLVANLSHELRTPLAGAHAIAETFQTAAEDPDQRARFLRLLNDEIERMSALVERMLRLAQLESEHEPLQLETLVPAHLLEKAAARASPLALQQNIHIKVEEAVVTKVAGSHERIGEVLANLLDNALRNSPANSRITLAALHEDGLVRFEIRDEGPGILLSERERIFERFYTGDNAREAGSGTGLGLAIARQLIQQQGGNIWVADRSPGATLCFTLAIAEDR
jgi:signal transduction histidine kinase